MSLGKCGKSIAGLVLGATIAAGGCGGGNPPGPTTDVSVRVMDDQTASNYLGNGRFSFSDVGEIQALRVANSPNGAGLEDEYAGLRVHSSRLGIDTILMDIVSLDRAVPGGPYGSEGITYGLNNTDKPVRMAHEGVNVNKAYVFETAEAAAAYNALRDSVSN